MFNIMNESTMGAWRYLPVLGRHFSVLFTQTDPMQIAPSKDADGRSGPSKQKLYHHFRLALLNFILILLFGTLGMQLCDGGRIDWTGIRAGTSPHVFSRQWAPSSIWPQADYGLAVIDCGFTGLMLAADSYIPQLPSRYDIVYYPDIRAVRFAGQLLSRTETDTMLRVRSRAHAILRYGLPPFYLLGAGTFELLFWLGGDLTPARIIFWGCGFPFLFLYISYFAFARVTYVILVSFYLRIQQRTLGRQLSSLNQSLERRFPAINPRKRGVPAGNSSSSTRLIVYHHFFRTINGGIMVVLDHIRVYTGHCKSILSIVLPFYISLTGYMFILAFFMPGSPPLFRYALMLYIVAVNGFLFFLIRQCSDVVTNNAVLLKGNARFNLLFERTGGFTLMTARNMIKTEIYHDARRFSEYSFWLLGDYRITSQTYSLIISYIGFLLMYLYKEDVKS